jgi:hypothetical protein
MVEQILSLLTFCLWHFLDFMITLIEYLFLCFKSVFEKIINFLFILIYLKKITFKKNRYYPFKYLKKTFDWKF